jgi:hypothetical protein
MDGGGLVKKIIDRKLLTENYLELENPAIWNYPAVRGQYAHAPNLRSTSSGRGPSKAVLSE